MTSYLLVIIIATLQTTLGSSVKGSIVALVDLNYDKRTDIITQTSKNSLSLFKSLVDSDAFSVESNFNVSVDIKSTIVDALVGDFDYDSYADLCVTYIVDDGGSEYHAKIFWGPTYELQKEGSGDIISTVVRPSSMDCNLDQISDIFTIDADSKRICYLGSGNRNISNNATVFLEDSKSALAPQSSVAMVDVTGDLHSEIILRVKGEDDTTLFEVYQWDFSVAEWKLMDGSFMPSPEDPKGVLMHVETASDTVLGQSSFSDFDSDGLIDHLIPACLDGPDCESPAILLWSKGSWNKIELDLKIDDNAYKFLADDVKNDALLYEKFSVRAGDYNLDGYADLIAVLQERGGDKNNVALLLTNIASTNSTDFSRTFRLEKSHSVQSDDSDKAIAMAAFFDLQDDATLEFFVEKSSKKILESGSRDYDSEIVFTSKLNPLGGDTSFLMVEIYTTPCFGCKDDRKGSGVALQGACMKYQGTNPDGGMREGGACQNAISTNRALNLPYTFVGLGRTPNFIDRLYVGIPSRKNESRWWPQIIPNARLFIIPYPWEHPSKWSSRLFISPNHLILLSAAVLSCVCGVILLIIAVLHWIEMKEDKKEKLEEAERINLAF